MKQKTASQVQPQERKEELQGVSSSEEKEYPHSVCFVNLYWETGPQTLEMPMAKRCETTEK